VNRVLAFLRVALTGLLLACVAGGALRSGGLPASAARALVLGLVVLGTASHARAEFPSPDLLGELQKRLLERPECVPECASRPRPVEARAEGWTVEGLHEDGLADDNLEIVRVG